MKKISALIIMIIAIALVGCSGSSNPDVIVDPTFDTDADEIVDIEDNCPDIANADQEDTDNDGVGDACDECPGINEIYISDNTGEIITYAECFIYADDAPIHAFICSPRDGVKDGCSGDPDQCTIGQWEGDLCQCVNNGRGHGSWLCADPIPPDADGDSITDSMDNCPAFANPDQEDTDLDGVGDACDACPVGVIDGTIPEPTRDGYRNLSRVQAKFVSGTLEFTTNVVAYVSPRAVDSSLNSYLELTSSLRRNNDRFSWGGHNSELFFDEPIEDAFRNLLLNAAMPPMHTMATAKTTPVSPPAPTMARPVLLLINDVDIEPDLICGNGWCDPPYFPSMTAPSTDSVTILTDGCAELENRCAPGSASFTDSSLGHCTCRVREGGTDSSWSCWVPD